MQTIESKGKVDKKRLGFVTLINTEVLANDGGPQYKQVREIPGNMQATQFIEMGIGWRLYDAKQEMPQLKTFDPEAARILKEQREAKERLDVEKLQTRIDLVFEAGGKPVIADLKAMSDTDFEIALEELKGFQSTDVDVTKKPGRPKKTI